MGEDPSSPQPLLNPEKLIVLRRPLPAAGGAGLDLPRATSHRDVRDGAVLGLAGAVGQDGALACALRQAHRLEGLGEGADLVGFYQHRVGRLHRHTLGDAFGIGDKQVVPHNLHPGA